MKKIPILVFISLLLLVISGYVYLEYGNRGSKTKLKNGISTESKISGSAFLNRENKSIRLETVNGEAYQFQIPMDWSASIAPFSPPGNSPVNKAYKISLQKPKDSIEINYFSPLKFHFYLGELGTYLKNQRHPLMPVEVLNEFFGHSPSNCQQISAPIKNWNGVKSPTAEYYSDVNMNWFEIKDTEKPTYYYMKIEKKPTPGVYGDLGSWNFSGFQFKLAKGQTLSEQYLQTAHVFYQSLKKRVSTADSDNKS
ncbi:MAG: hypothetical protein GVX96_01830 [Bacteroidetes bacterium]|jgi:hypothetical protein|nr:hypothetical protein [Bacteroidota bacterium]